MMKVRKMWSPVERDWGAFIVKISIFFVDKEKEQPERINTLKQSIP